MAKIITAAPATLLTTLPIITGVGVFVVESDPESCSVAAGLVEAASVATAVPPAIPNTPASVDVARRDDVIGE